MSELSLIESNKWSRFWQRLLLGKGFIRRGDHAYPFDANYNENGAVVTPENTLKLSAAWACIRLRSQTIASLPLNLMNSDKKIATEHRLYKILHDAPNAAMNAYNFWQMQILSLDCYGNAYSLIHKNKVGDIVALEPLFAEKITINRAINGALSYTYTLNEDPIVYSETDILHFRVFSSDGIVGKSPISYASDYLGDQMIANSTARSNFKNNLKVGGFLKTGERMLTDEQRTRLKTNLDTYAQPENAGKYLVLEGGMDVSNTSMRINPADAQLLESRYFGIEEICRAFGVPPQLIGHTNKASSWASSLENTNQQFLQYSLTPVLKNIELEVTKKLFSLAEKDEYYVRFVVQSLLRSDNQSRASYYNTMLQNGVMTRNEVRNLEDLPAVDGADDLTIQLNMTSLQASKSEAEKDEK